MIPPNAAEVIKRISEIASRGPVRAIGHGSTAVGMTLLHHLGVKQSTTSKPTLNGIVVTARRSVVGNSRNRVNLFARVPNWKISPCKSSAEIVAKYGYPVESGARKLFCTVDAMRPNPQGLVLRLRYQDRHLCECFSDDNEEVGVATWELDDLHTRLVQSHPETIWVTASSIEKHGMECFQYRMARYTGAPLTHAFETLISEGTVTLDHLIESRAGRTTEKGPLFKIAPDNLPLLFPTSGAIDLLEPLWK